MTQASRWRVAAVVVVGLFMAILDTTIVSVTLPQMQRAFHTDFATITWVASAYFLAQAAVIPIVGYLSDRVGAKLIFLTALILFTAGSALCAVAPTKEALIAFRVFQGIGGGALLPMAFAIIFRIFPPTERGMANALLGIPAVMAPGFGPTIGGYLSTSFAWNAIFLINVPIGVVALILAFLVLPGQKAEPDFPARPAGRNHFDIAGLLLSMVGFSVLVFGLTSAGSQGWGNATVLTFIIGGLAVLLAFIVVELRVSDPVIDLRLFASYTFTIANLLLWIVSGVFFGSLFLLPLFFENIQGQTALFAGELLISQGLAMGVGIALSGTLYNRVGPRLLAATGLVLLVVGTSRLTQLEVNTTGLSLQIWLVLRGLGLGFTMPALQTMAVSKVSNRAMARASSLVTVTRMVASAIGVASLTTYLTQQATSHGLAIEQAIKAGLTTHHLSGVAATCAQLTGSTFNQAAVRVCVTQHAATQGLDDTFWAVLICCAVSIVLALIVGRDPAVRAYQEARARGEEVAPERLPALSE
jgi:EmrB/QacA subfamily drug resistance transporter